MIRTAELISREYRALQVELHKRKGGYGDTGERWAPAVRDLIQRFNATSVLDYGCGQGSLKKALKPICDPSVRIDEYDPAVAGKDGDPSFADLVVCTDVLEHVEPNRLDKTLEHLRLLKRKAVFVAISTCTAKRTLKDGRNAHLIVESADWWIAKMRAFNFDVSRGPASPGKYVHEVPLVLT